jgi:hypothetical protein
MKKTIIFVSLLLTLSLISATTIQAQSLEERLNKFGTNFAKGYVTPFVSAFGANLNSGLYHNSDLQNGVDVYIGAKVMLALIPTSAQEFNADLSELNALTDDALIGNFPTPVKTATIFGSKDKKTISTTGGATTVSEDLPPGLNLKAVPLAVPHVTIGNFYGTRAMLRFFPQTKLGDYGKFSFFGIGVQHNIGQWMPTPLPFDWSAHIMYQSMTVKPLIEASAFSLGTEISKTLMFATFYGGIAYESASMTFKYDWEPQLGTTTLPTQKVKFDLKGDNTFRLTAGLALKLAILHISADYSLAKQPVATLGIGIAI